MQIEGSSLPTGGIEGQSDFRDCEGSKFGAPTAYEEVAKGRSPRNLLRYSLEFFNKY